MVLMGIASFWRNAFEKKKSQTKQTVRCVRVTHNECLVVCVLRQTNKGPTKPDILCKLIEPTVHCMRYTLGLDALAVKCEEKQQMGYCTLLMHAMCSVQRPMNSYMISARIFHLEYRFTLTTALFFRSLIRPKNPTTAEYNFTRTSESTETNRPSIQLNSD